ncbi:MAG: glutamate--tRNA ligase [Boseongicola sp. SB0670_bin_30]|nr:glutamate--tRNA ligase [Boseongicola sp. SB0670_bin_30]
MTESPVVTRFAPSPTGNLHIGGARTALFNWLYARHAGGSFRLRIEDTDRARSTPEAKEAIITGLNWLGIDWDGKAVSQFERAGRHAEVAREMLARGSAYKCFLDQEETAALRDKAQSQGERCAFRSPWRDAPERDHPDAPYAIRVKAPSEGEARIRDKVQGDVTIRNDQLDDMIVLRSDGTPVYMLAVVVDDHDMGVTHVIRGDDHLNNAARQMLVYNAMGWNAPVWAHVPLIHGEDGKKLSKRHGALGIQDWAAMGYPAASMRNYLLRLGWSHGDDEIFTMDEARAWFDLSGLKKSPARLDTKKLGYISGRHIATMSTDAELLEGIQEYLALSGKDGLTAAQESVLERAMFCLRDRAKTYPDLLEMARFALTSRPIIPDAESAGEQDVTCNRILSELTPHLQNGSWERRTLESIVRELAEANHIKLGKLAGTIRIALAGRRVSPSIFDMMLVLGRDETILRLADASS